MTIRPLVELLAVKKKKENKGSINEEIHTQVSFSTIIVIQVLFLPIKHYIICAFSSWISFSQELNAFAVIMDIITGKTSTVFSLLSPVNTVKQDLGS